MMKLTHVSELLPGKRAGRFAAIWLLAGTIVLMAGAGCGLLPQSAALADPAIEERLDHWVRTPARQLGERATELALRLEVALAA